MVSSISAGTNQSYHLLRWCIICGVERALLKDLRSGGTVVTPEGISQVTESVLVFVRALVQILALKPVFWRSFVVCYLSIQRSRQNLGICQTRFLSNSLFTDHLPIRRCIICGSEEKLNYKQSVAVYIWHNQLIREIYVGVLERESILHHILLAFGTLHRKHMHKHRSTVALTSRVKVRNLIGIPY
jgi:hypothetical protein